MKKFDVLIIGAGVVGLSIAQSLSKYDLSVCVLDAADDVSAGSSKANSGIIHGGFDDKAGTVKGRYSKFGYAAIKSLNEHLHFGFREVGSYVLAFSEEEERVIAALYENGVQNGVRGLSLLQKEAVLEREKHINADLRGALFSAYSGVVSPYEFVMALADNALDNGVFIKLRHEVAGITKCGSAGFEVETNAGNFEARVVINAAGINSDRISDMLGCKDYDITPVKGQYILLGRDAGGLTGAVLFQAPTEKGKGILISQTYHGNILIGPDAKPSQKNDTSTDLESLAEIYVQAQKTIARIPMHRCIATYAGVRANNTKKDFIIRESREGFIECAGMMSPGLTSAPAIAEDVVHNYIAKHVRLAARPDYKAEHPALIASQKDRGMVSGAEAQARAALPLEYARCFVCRCEQVERKTIDAAIAASKLKLTNTDAIKKRTRAGMGYCQGAFCKSRVEHVLAEHAGAHPEPQRAPQNAPPAPKRVTAQELLAYLKSKGLY